MITPSFGLTATERVVPKLALDFTTASLDSRITFTRSGNTATVVGSDGYIATINADLPRFDYDPVTLICKGLLIEESRQNILFPSNDFANVAWTPTEASVVSVANIDPEGNANSQKLVDTEVNSVHRIGISMAVTPNTYTVSLYVKAAEISCFSLIRSGSGLGSARFNLTTMTATNISDATNLQMITQKNGWVRCSMTWTSAVSITRILYIQLEKPAGTASYTGNGTDGLFLYGMQREIGASPTSYIPTTTTAVTRNADVATMTGTNFSDWFNTSQGTLCATGTTFNGQGTASYANALFAVTDNVNDFCCLNRYVNAASGTVRNGGVTQASFSVADGWLSGETHSASISYKDADFGYALDGVAEAPVASGSIPAGVDRAYIGRSFDGSDFRTWNGHVLELSYYPQRLTDAELAAITA